MSRNKAVHQFNPSPMQDNCDTSQSCSRGVCLRSCWTSTSGRGRKPSSSARSSWPCSSCCQRREPQLPSVWNTPGSPPRSTSCVCSASHGLHSFNTSLILWAGAFSHLGCLVFKLFWYCCILIMSFTFVIDKTEVLSNCLTWSRFEL